MPYRKKTTTRPRRMRPRRRFGIARSIRYNKVPSFVETFHAQDVSTQNAGGTMTVTASAIPQFAQYAELYKQYRINWVKVFILTDYNSYDPGTGGLPNIPRLVYAVNDTVAPAAPAGENDILTDNGARIRHLDKPVSFSFRPVPYLQQITGGGNVGVNKKMQWINSTEGAVQHGGVQFWISGGGAPGALARVYYKVSFSLRDGN